jgi:hypothetical protein
VCAAGVVEDGQRLGPPPPHKQEARRLVHQQQHQHEAQRRGQGAEGGEELRHKADGGTG